jgi:hypothetical protein
MKLEELFVILTHPTGMEFSCRGFGVKALVTVQYLISFPPAGVCGLSMIYSLVINQNDNMEERVN